MLNSIPLKGRFPVKDYFFTLADIYVKHQDEEYSPEDAQARLAGYAERFQGIGIDFIAKLFPKAIIEKKRVFERLPVVLGDAQPEKLEFNLHYQDTRIKLAVEDKLGSCRDLAEYQQDAQDLMEVVAILLNTVWDGQPLWRSLTDNDLDALIYMTLGSYDSTQEEKLLKAGYEANERALQGLMEWEKLNGHSLEKLISYQIFAGTVWWLDTEPNLDTQFTEMGTLEINDFERFQNEVLGKPCKLVFFFDDNGELVWDLILIERLLHDNQGLQVLGVICTEVIANNANKYTLTKCLQHPRLIGLKLQVRFSTFEEYNLRSAIDLAYCSQTLLNIIQSANYAYIKGASFFESLQKLPINSYYGFVVHSHDSEICTGLPKGNGVFVRIPQGKMGYHYLKYTLRELYPTFTNVRKIAAT